MEGLILPLVIAFVIYRFIRKVNPEAWQKMIEQAQEQQRRQQNGQTDAIEVDTSRWLRDVLSTKADHTGDTETPIPTREGHMITNEEPDGLFEENAWRRQLFMFSIVVGVGYLVYLIVI